MLYLFYASTRYDCELVKWNIREVRQAWKSATGNLHRSLGRLRWLVKTLHRRNPRWFLHCRFLQFYIFTDHHGFSDCLCSVPSVDLVSLICLLQSMPNILEEAATKLKLVKVGTSRYWQSQWPFDEAFWQMMLRRSMIVDPLLF